MHGRNFVILLLTGSLWLPSHAQELEPRRWGHLPLGANFLGVGYVYTSGDIALDPVLQIEDADVEMHSLAAKYIHSFELLGKSARFDLVQVYQNGDWEGLLNGTPTAVSRSGWSDTTIRFAVNLLGAPPLAGKEFANYRAGVQCETIVGVGLVAVLPTGEYFDDKLINLGENRFSFRPQLGIVHSRGPWTAEFTGSAWLYTDNDEFWNGNLREQDPLVSVQSHLIYTFRPGLWLGASLGYDFGGQSTINGMEKDDSRGLLSWALTCGVNINRNVGIKLGYISSRTQERIGSDLDHFVLAVSVMW